MSTIHPALGNVLACLTGEEFAYKHRFARSPMFASDAVTWHWTGRKPRCKYVEKSTTRPLTLVDAEAAIDRLRREELYPWGVDDSAAPLWGCNQPFCGNWCPCNAGNGWSKSLPEIDEFAAVASFGGPALQRAVGLAGVFAPGRSVVWRVMTSEAIRKHHVAIAMIPMAQGISIPWAFSRRESGIDIDAPAVNAWPSKCPYADPAVVTAWPSMRSLARSDGQYRPTGMHLIALDDKFVTIGLERP